MSSLDPERPLIANNTWDVETDCLPPEAITRDDYIKAGGIPVSHIVQTEDNWQPGVEGDIPPNGSSQKGTPNWSSKAAFN